MALSKVDQIFIFFNDMIHLYEKSRVQGVWWCTFNSRKKEYCMKWKTFEKIHYCPIIGQLLANNWPIMGKLSKTHYWAIIGQLLANNDFFNKWLNFRVLYRSEDSCYHRTFFCNVLEYIKGIHSVSYKNQKWPDFDYWGLKEILTLVEPAWVLEPPHEQTQKISKNK